MMSNYTTESGFKQSAVLEQRGKFKKLYFNPKLHEANSQVRVDSKEHFAQTFTQNMRTYLFFRKRKSAPEVPRSRNAASWSILNNE